MKIEVIIPNYNGSHLIRSNLEAVIDATRKYDTQITIIDDCSEMSDFEKLNDYITGRNASDTQVPIQLLRNDKNLGFASTVNKVGLQSKADFLVLLNSDVRPLKGFLNPVWSQFENDPKLFGVGCMDRSIENDGVVLRGRGIGVFHKGFLIHKKGNTAAENTLWISGGSSIVRADIFQKLRGFDSLYNPFYWEDIDLSYRALKSGYELRFNNESIVEHRHEEGSIKKHFTPLHISSIAYRNQLLFIWKNITDGAFILQHVIWLIARLIQSIIRFDLVFLNGFMKAFVLLPRAIQSRLRARKLFEKSDKNVLRSFEREFFQS